MNTTIPTIHLVSFDVPDPADYGGVIDVFHKIRALHEAGVAIILHCFQYGRPESERLRRLCAEVHYYPRLTGLKSQLSTIPYIVRSRRSKALVNRLLQDDFPILAEGLHSTGFLCDARFAGRTIFCRTANIEHHYYMHLAKGERHLLRKAFFLIESVRLKHYEHQLKKVTKILAISPPDQQYFEQRFGKEKVTGIYAFHQYDKVDSLPGKGEYFLYHGKLDVAENYCAVLQMLPVFEGWEGLPLWVAGMNPPPFLVDAIAKYPMVKLITNPTSNEMQELIHQAHAHLLLTAQPTGLKLKLLAALFYGRFVVVNNEMVAGTGLEPLCLIGNTNGALIDILKAIQEQTFTHEAMTHRSKLLTPQFTNAANAARLKNLI